MRVLCLINMCIIVVCLACSDALAQSKFKSCDSIDEERLTNELELICKKTFDSKSFDLRKSMTTAWSALRVDAAIDRSVDMAIQQVSRSTGDFEKFFSGFSESKAQELSAEVSKRAFESEIFTKTMDNLVESIARDASKQIDLWALESESKSFVCLKEFMGKQYAKNLSDIFKLEMNLKGPQLDGIRDVKVSSSILEMHGKGVAGAALVALNAVFKRSINTIATRIASRIAGRVAANFVSKLVSRGIPIFGTMLIIQDIVENKNGILPELSVALKDPAIKKEVFDQVGSSLAEELNKRANELPVKIANTFISLWADFKGKFQDVLEYSQKNSKLRQLIENSSPDQFPKISTLFSISRTIMSDEELGKTFTNGQFVKALRFNDDTYQILSYSKSMDVYFQWVNTYPAQIDMICSLGIYKYKSPGDLGKDVFQQILSYDRDTLLKLIRYDSGDIILMSDISRDNLKKMFSFLSPAEIKMFIKMYKDSDVNFRNNLVTLFSGSPVVVKKLNDEIVDYIRLSSDPMKTFDFFTTDITLSGAYNDVKLLINKSIDRKMFMLKYDFVYLAICSVVVLVSLYILYKFLALFARRSSSSSR